MLLSLLLFASFARADWRDLDVGGFSIPPPPFTGSSEDLRDREEVLRAMSEHGRQDCAFARAHPDYTFDSLYYGGILSADEIRRARPVIDGVFTVAGRVAKGFQRRYGRPRPFDEDPRVQTCSPRRTGNPAYPSGHATAGAASACVLAQLYPEKAAALEKYGDYIGDYRVGIGVHHPLDVAAGKQLGRDICRALLRDGQFRAELGALR